MFVQGADIQVQWLHTCPEWNVFWHLAKCNSLYRSIRNYTGQQIGNPMQDEPRECWSV